MAAQNKDMTVPCGDGLINIRVGAVIAKVFQPGAEKLRAAGYRVEALAAVSHMAEGVIEFED